MSSMVVGAIGIFPKICETLTEWGNPCWTGRRCTVDLLVPTSFMSSIFYWKFCYKTIRELYLAFPFSWVSLTEPMLPGSIEWQPNYSTSSQHTQYAWKFSLVDKQLGFNISFAKLTPKFGHLKAVFVNFNKTDN
jgi:hypothetical protein